jgi:hypothetical protein
VSDRLAETIREALSTWRSVNSPLWEHLADAIRVPGEARTDHGGDNDMSDSGIKLTREEALFCLEAVACVFQEGHAPKVGQRESDITHEQGRDLVERLIRAAGVPREVAAPFFDWGCGRAGNT